MTNEPKKFWNYVGEWKKESRLPDIMYLNDVTFDDQKKIVNAFAKYFGSVYKPTNNNINVSNSSKAQLDYKLKLDQADVKMALKALPDKMPSGTDLIPSFLVKLNADVLSDQLTYIYNLSLEEGIYPARGKEVRSDL